MRSTGILLALLTCLASLRPALGDPGTGIHFGELTLRPFTDLSETYDSNINQTGGSTRDDFFTQSVLGLRAGYTTYDLDCTGLGFLSYRNYARTQARDFSEGGDVLQVRYGTRDTLSLSAEQSYRQLEDTDLYGNSAAIGGVSPDSVLDVTSRTRRSVNQAGLSAAHDLSGQLGVEAGYRFDEVRYDQAALHDLRNHIGQVEFDSRLTDKTAALLTAKGAVQQDINQEQDANYYALRAGMRMAGTDRTSLKGGIGLQGYELPSSETRTSFHFDLAANWLASDAVTVQAGGRNGNQMSSLYAGNGIDYTSVWLGGIYEVTPSLTTSLSGAYRTEDYINPVSNQGTLIDRTDKGFACRLRADYRAPAQFLQLYSEAIWENMDSNVQSYDEMRLMVGTILTY